MAERRRLPRACRERDARGGGPSFLPPSRRRSDRRREGHGAQRPRASASSRGARRSRSRWPSCSCSRRVAPCARRRARPCWRCGSSIATESSEILALYLNLAPYGNRINGVCARQPRLFWLCARAAHAGAGRVSRVAAAAAERLQSAARSRARASAAAAHSARA